MADWAELAAAVDSTAVATFKRTVTYRPTGGDEAEAVGVFDAPGLRLDISSGVAIETMGPPRLTVIEADLPTGIASRNDRWTVGGVTYRVAEISRDGYGAATLTGERFS